MRQQHVQALRQQVAPGLGLFRPVDGGGDRAVERGDTQFGALLGPVLMGLVLAASLAVCVYALADERTLLRWAPAVIPALLFGWLYWRYHAVHRPRTVAELGELERQLPG